MHGEVEADEHEDTERYRDGSVCPYKWTWTLPVILEKRLASCFKCYTHSWPHHHLNLTPVSMRGPMRWRRRISRNSLKSLMFTLLVTVKYNKESWQIKDHVVMHDIETPGRLFTENLATKTLFTSNSCWWFRSHWEHCVGPQVVNCKENAFICRTTAT